MARSTRTSTLKAAAAVPIEVEPTSSGRQRTLSAKQQQIVTEKVQKQASAQDKAYTQALRAHQVQEEIMGFRKLPVHAGNSLSGNVDEEMGAESEDEDDPATAGNGFTAMTLAPIIKTSVRNGRTLVHRVDQEKENVNATELQVHVNEQVEKQQPKLIRRVTGQARPTVMMGSNGSALPSPTPQQQSSQVAELAPHRGPGPYSPHSQSFYGAGDGTYYQHFDDVTKSVVEEAISIYRAQIGAVEPYPDRVEDREAAVAAWVEACNGRGIRIEFDQDIMKLITARASQARGQLKTLARPLVEAAYGISPANPKRDNRNLNLADRTGLYRHPIIQTIINKMYFKNKTDDGIVNPEFSENEELSLVTLALVLTVIDNCLDEWQTGEHVDVQFSAAAYKNKFIAHLKRLEDFAEKTKDANIVSRLRKHLLKMAKYFSYRLMTVSRKHAKADDAPQVIQAARVTEDEVEAAKKEWEGLVLSEEED
ncbi:hypothetical protein K443DRAFT_117147 [Laccaria amethystina LaAM-08-1]|uniref:DUF6532 domain-containing protein n=1 Tax=Laccaria amethystina LaAM-08-1 TaxID=1095629 RepID=A0A0C9WXH2_9AGAR|nr:hypothetical protein K443DRAFT_117147 [Laccaria amethystina LaAM-08-1]